MNAILNASEAEAIAASHPLLDWYGKLHQWGARFSGRDLILSPMIAARFAIGCEEDGVIVLGIQEADLPALMSVKWSSSAVIRNHLDRDWLALSSDDAGVNEGDKPFKLRLFFPIAMVMADQFADYDRDDIRLRAMRVIKGTAKVATGDPRATIRFAKKGFE